ncbi:DEAD/DEAH box helicase family protein, partial [Vibrio parahaemolyticus VPTS-2010_2]
FSHPLRRVRKANATQHDCRRSP